MMLWIALRQSFSLFSRYGWIGSYGAFGRGFELQYSSLYHHSKWAPCGKIRTLERRATPTGGVGLGCEATVHPEYVQAPFTGFSMRTCIEKYEIEQGPKGPYAAVLSAVLLEVSLIPTPCNPDCVILEREDLPEVTPMLIEAINAQNVADDRFSAKLRCNAAVRSAATPTAKCSISYSITSSACSRADSGIVRPSALAVFRLIANSNTVGCSIGSSPGFAPRRIRAT